MKRLASLFGNINSTQREIGESGCAIFVKM